MVHIYGYGEDFGKMRVVPDGASGFGEQGLVLVIGSDNESPNSSWVWDYYYDFLPTVANFSRSHFRVLVGMWPLHC